MKKTIPFLILLLIPILQGCSPKLVFTQSIKEKVQRVGGDLTKIQYYNETEILLQRVLSKTEVGIAKGKVEVRDGKQIESIRFNPLTPGICMEHMPNKLKVSFESGSTRFLFFKKLPRGENYVLVANRDVGGKKIVNYDGKPYELIGGSRLLYKKNQVTKIVRKERVATGQKVK